MGATDALFGAKSGGYLSCREEPVHVSWLASWWHPSPSCLLSAWEQFLYRPHITIFLLPLRTQLKTPGACFNVPCWDQERAGRLFLLVMEPAHLSVISRRAVQPGLHFRASDTSFSPPSTLPVSPHLPACDKIALVLSPSLVSLSLP